MTHSYLDPDDPRLTAYALGELNASERAELERLLSESPAAQAALADIRSLAAELRTELARESVPAITRPARVQPVMNVHRRRRYSVIAVALSAVVMLAAMVGLTWLPRESNHEIAQTTTTLGEPIALGVVAGVGGAEGLPADGEVVAVGDETHFLNFRSTSGEAYDRYRADSLGTRVYEVEELVRGESPVLTAAPQSGPQPGQAFGLSAGARVLPTQEAGKEVRGIARKSELAPVDPKPLPALKALTPQSEAKTTTWYYAEGDVEKLQDERRPLLVERETRLLRERLVEEQEAVPAGGVPGSEAYETIIENPFLSPIDRPLSTFSIDVDTASYSNVRRFLNSGQRPPKHAVRIEELINYFDYAYPPPDGDVPFAVHTEIATCPWQPEHQLVRIGLKGREVPREQRPPSNLVFLIDVSGSMRPANKLPLVKSALQMLVEGLTEKDRLAMVVYAGSAGLVLESTPGHQQDVILSAIERLEAGGSTNGAEGIQLAYQQARQHFIQGGVNRVILCTDGDFNVGISSDDALVQLIQQEAKSGVFLSVFGFGMGNLKDSKLEKLADKGNGHYAYIDDRHEARKVFVEELNGTLVTIAKDVKIQVEFNPSQVGAYRLIGYENRALADRDFNDDTKDAGEIGAGHTVTALYEIVPAEKVHQDVAAVRLRYQRQVTTQKGRSGDEVLLLKLRYKHPDSDTSTLVEYPAVSPHDLSKRPSLDFQWASAVAAFGLVLRDSQFQGSANLALVRELAQASRGSDATGRRQEFVELVEKAERLLERAK